MNHKHDLLNKIYLGEVSTVQDYGAFIKLPGTKDHGLVHRSQISNSNVDDATDVLNKGDNIWCKVISVNEEGKIGLSMKLVDQGSGKDLDPNGVIMHQDELKKKSKPPRDGRRAITLEAVLKTTCSKCKTPGHLAKDCFQSPDGKTYALIPEDDPLPSIPPLPIPSSKIEKEKQKEKKSEKHKKEKKSKKHKKEKKKKHKRKHSSSDSSSDDSNRKKRKKSKHQ